MKLNHFINDLEQIFQNNELPVGVWKKNQLILTQLNLISTFGSVRQQPHYQSQLIVIDLQRVEPGLFLIRILLLPQRSYSMLQRCCSGPDLYF